MAVLAFVLLSTLLWGCGKRQDNAPRTENSGTESAGAESPVSPQPLAAPENSPPRVASLKLEPANAIPGTLLKVAVEADDPDGDPVTIDFEWLRNGEVISGAIMDEIDTAEFQHGDAISVTAVPFDGKIRGEAMRSPTLTLLNRPPEIVSLPPAATVDGLYVYEVKATDPDGDLLSYSLDQFPSGMHIDAGTGRIEWPVSVGMEGDFTVRLIVSDGSARVFQNFNISLKTVNEAQPKPVPNKSPGT